MKSVIFVEPSGSSANVFDQYMKLPLLGSLYMGTILHNSGYKVKIINENILGRRLSPVELKADYVCFSSLTLNAGRIIELSRTIRQVYPQTKIIVGGIHASLMPEEFTDIADHVHIGEGENTILDIVSGRYTEKIIKGSPVEDLDTLPVMNYDLLENARSMSVIPLMTSRGCPFNCNFCTVTKTFGRLYRKQSPKRVMEEIRNALRYFKIRDMFFYDDNLTADRKRILELMDLLIGAKERIVWTAQLRADIAREPELLEKMYKAGCNRVYIGFESISDAVLSSLKKSQTREDIEKAIRIIQNRGISIHGMFMLGEDNDTIENIRATVDFAIRHDISTVQFMILTPLPGTEVYEKLKRENRLIHTDWNYYNGMYPVYYPAKMSAAVLQDETISAYKKFYSFSRTALDVLYFGFNAFFDAMMLKFDQLNKYDLTSIYIKLGARYIIKKFLKINKPYFDFLKKLEDK